MTAIKRFTVFRRGDLSETHGPGLQNAPNIPQFEGVVFTDGTCVLRWLTAYKSTSVWPSLQEALAVHGHPEVRYGTEIVFHDNPSPVEEVKSEPTITNPEFDRVELVPAGDSPFDELCGTFQWSAKNVGFGEVDIWRKKSTRPNDPQEFTYTIENETMSRQFVKNMFAHFIDNAIFAD